MRLSCHSALHKLRGKVDLAIALAGNPNVGKSSIFNSLTGMGVETANYPGMTVEVNMAETSFEGRNIGIFDLPGTYALGAVSEDQWVARQGVLDGNPDAVIMVVDATNLARNLYMVLQFLELGYPMVIALNVLDLAQRQGRQIDIRRLSELLDVPVVPTVANRGEGLDDLMRKAVEVADAARRPKPESLVYGRDVEKLISQLTGAMETAGAEDPYSLPPRALALLLLEHDTEFIDLVRSTPGWDQLLDLAANLRQKMVEEHGQPAHTRVAAERHALAGIIVDEVETLQQPEKIGWGERLWRYTTSPKSGMVILLLVLASVFLTLYVLGNFLAGAMGNIWDNYISPPVKNGVFDIFGHNVVTSSLLWAVDGIEAALTVGIPYVLVFYIMLAILEDTGYLNSVAFLTDALMHRFGLHGRAMIPIVAGAGCNVPAIIGTRVLSTMRERIVAGTLIVLVPCSARTAVIFGAVAFYAGIRYALLIYVIILVLWLLVGLGLNKVIPGKPTGLVMEMFPFRRPHAATVVKKTWYRFKSFVFMAAPILIGGSILLGALFETGYLFELARPMSPLVEGWMGLPAVSGLALIMAILRKELALQLLVTIAIAMGASETVGHDLHIIMSDSQLFIYALVTAIYIPCAATIAALARELGWRRSIYIMAFTIVLAVLIGGLANQAIKLTAV